MHVIIRSKRKILNLKQKKIPIHLVLFYKIKNKKIYISPIT